MGKAAGLPPTTGAASGGPGGRVVDSAGLAPGAAALAVVAERLPTAGVTPEPLEGGLLIHDPAKNAINAAHRR